MRRTCAVLVVAVVMVVAGLGGGVAEAAKPLPSIAASLSYNGCQAVSTVSWSGYRADEIVHSFYRNGSFVVAIHLEPQGSKRSGTSVAENFVTPARSGEDWLAIGEVRTAGKSGIASVSATTVSVASPLAC